MSLSEQLAKDFINVRNDQVLQRMMNEQSQCLEIYQSTQQRLEAFNNFSKARYQDIHKHFETHTSLLKEMKHDLHSVFTKLRKIKATLAQKYPDEMQRAIEKHPPPVLEE